MVAMAPLAHSRVVLRLDSGALVGSGAQIQGGPSQEAVVLAVDRAFRSGRVSEAQIARVSSLLSELRAKVPAAAGLSGPPLPYANGTASIGHKRPAPEPLQVATGPSRLHGLLHPDASRPQQQPCAGAQPAKVGATCAQQALSRHTWPAAGLSKPAASRGLRRARGSTLHGSAGPRVPP